jgi:hypothetical protein
LQVTLGGLDNDDIFDMSGGWQQTFNLNEASSVSLTFRYQLTQDPDYESDEYSQVLVGIDGVLIGQSSADYVDQITGNGNDGDPESTGWQLVTLNLGTLAAGNHTLTIGGFNNKKTYNNESTEVLIDDLLVVGSEPLPELQLYLEAESGSGLENWDVVSSGSASAGQYISWDGFDNYNDPGANDQVTYAFNAPAAGLYQVHLRVDTGSSTSFDSVWITIDDADLGQSQNITRGDGWVKFNNMVLVSTWTWDQVHNADDGNTIVEFYLTPGAHTLRLAYRESDTWIDQIYITNTGIAP